MKTGTFSKNWLRSKVCSISWWLASITIIALLAASCRSTKQTSVSSVADRLEWNRKVSASLATIPMSLAELTIPIDSLRNLPAKAVYTKKSGQATVTISLKGDSAHVTATCDSLAQLVYNLEEELHRARSELEQKEVVKEAPEFTLKCYLTGIITGIIALLIFQYIRKWKRKIKSGLSV